MELIVNYAGASIIGIRGETYALAEKSGADLAYVQQFFQMTFAHPAMKMYAEKARKRDFRLDVGFAMSAGRTDIRLMRTAADEVGVAFEIGKIIERKMLTALSGDLADADWSATCEVTRGESAIHAESGQNSGRDGRNGLTGILVSRPARACCRSPPARGRA